MLRKVKYRILFSILLVLCALNSSNIAQDQVQVASLQSEVKACFSELLSKSNDIGYVFYDSKGNELASYNKNKALTPASNQKIVTSGAAYKILSSSFKFQTIIFHKGKIANGQLFGDLIVYGAGDPTIGTNYNGTDESREIFKDFAKKIKDAGIKVVTGDIIFIKTMFDNEYRHKDWPEDQILKYYEAPISALSFNDNCINLDISAGSTLSSPAKVTITPKYSGINVLNKVYTRKAGGNPIISYNYQDDSTLVVSGTIPLRSQSYTSDVAVMNPEKLFSEVFAGTLGESGIIINGFVKIPDTETSLLDAEPLIVHQTNLMKILKIMNQQSQNFYAELVFKRVGAFSSKKTGSFETGKVAVSEFLKNLSIDSIEFEIADGSGLSNSNRLSVNALSKVLLYFPEEMRKTLAVSGDAEGTMKRRFIGNMKGKIYAKTGTINKVDALSGYIVDSSEHWHPFSIIVNTNGHNHSVVRQKMDSAVKIVFDYFAKND